MLQRKMQLINCRGKAEFTTHATQCFGPSMVADLFLGRVTGSNFQHYFASIRQIGTILKHFSKHFGKAILFNSQLDRY